MLKKKWSKCVFGHELCDLLVLDEASQMNLPEAVMAALPLKADAPVVVVGDHRQMPPIVKHDWDAEARRTFRQFQVYETLRGYSVGSRRTDAGRGGGAWSGISPWGRAITSHPSPMRSGGNFFRTTSGAS
jgi:hypothetical protein